MCHGKPVLRIALVVMTRPRAMATIFRTGRGRAFWGLYDDTFNPLFKLADFALNKCFEITVHMLQFSAYVLLATRRNLDRKPFTCLHHLASANRQCSENLEFFIGKCSLCFWAERHEASNQFRIDLVGLRSFFHGECECFDLCSEKLDCIDPFTNEYTPERPFLPSWGSKPDIEIVRHALKDFQ